MPERGALTVPAAQGKLRFWRNTAAATLAPGTSLSLTAGTLGYEWDEDVANAFRPAGLIRLSDTTLDSVAASCRTTASTYGPATATHS